MSKTIMLVHGAWVTTDCWTSFRDFFEAKGHRVVVPEWPYLDRPAEELRRSPDPRLAKMTIKGLVDHFEKPKFGICRPLICPEGRANAWRVDRSGMGRTN